MIFVQNGWVGFTSYCFLSISKCTNKITIVDCMNRERKAVKYILTLLFGDKNKIYSLQRPLSERLS